MVENVGLRKHLCNDDKKYPYEFLLIMVPPADTYAYETPLFSQIPEKFRNVVQETRGFNVVTLL